MSTTQKFTVTCEKTGSPKHTIRKPETGPASYAVLNALAEIKDTELEDLNPRYTVIDPDALDQLFQHTNQDESNQNIGISFPYEGYNVTIGSEGSVSRGKPRPTND